MVLVPFQNSRVDIAGSTIKPLTMSTNLVNVKHPRLNQ